MQTRGRFRYSKRHKTLIHRLIKARKKAGLSQTDVAKYLKKTQPNISKLEAGQRGLEVLEILELARLYKKDVIYFLK